MIHTYIVVIIILCWEHLLIFIHAFVVCTNYSVTVNRDIDE